MAIRFVAVVTAILIFVLLIHSFDRPAIQAQNAPAVSQPNNRFQIVFSPHARADTFLIDTQTGRVWEQVTFNDVEGDPQVWDYQDRIDNDEQFRTWMGKQILKKK